ncbi:MAG: exodeoxyribonuclease VII large subunit [Gammaproteobacteria bacterium]|jgi:exodeoxyribonuclease VII large subunit
MSSLPPSAPSRTPIASQRIFSVTELNMQARELLESNFATLWVEGELSNLARPRSGHIYFTLKDDGCQVRCAMFRMNNRRVNFEPRDGQQVLITARVSLYAERGDYQLIVQHMEEAGAGALRRAFDALQSKLAIEGLFDEDRKRPLPELPSRVGVITSPSGAAIRDVLTTLQRRFPAIDVLIYPVPVQGASAAPAIVRALDRAAQRAEVDVLILTRGGGSLEDLWPFNEESVARAIARCSLPVVSGVGHEVDVTIADYCADRRAATPTAAAELVSPDAREWRSRRDNALRRLQSIVESRLRGERQALAWLLRRLRHPRQRIEHSQRRREELLRRLVRALDHKLDRQGQDLRALLERLRQQHPQRALAAQQTRVTTLLARLHREWSLLERRNRDRLSTATRALENISPQRTLERGYAIVHHDLNGELLRDPQQVRAGDAVTATLAGGKLPLQVREPAAD